MVLAIRSQQRVEEAIHILLRCGHLSYEGATIHTPASQDGKEREERGGGKGKARIVDGVAQDRVSEMVEYRRHCERHTSSSREQ